MRQILLLLFCIPLLATAANKITLAVMPFTASGYNTEQYTNQVFEIVNTTFVNSKRFNMIERSQVDKIFKEKNIQKQEDFFDGVIAEQAKNNGAQYIILGHLNYANAQTYGVSLAAGSQGKASVTLRVVDVSTQIIIASETIETQAGSVGNDHHGAITKAIKEMQPKITQFINTQFPLSYTLVQITNTTKKGEAKDVLISGGRSSGLTPGTKLEVVEPIELEVEGTKKIRNKKIGTLTVKNIEDNDFSIAEVTSGGTEIAQCFSNKIKLLIKTSQE